MVLLGRQIAFALEEVVTELANVVLVFIPLVDPVAFFDPVHEVALVEGGRRVDLASLTLGQVVDPVALVEQFGSSELAVPVGLVVLDRPLVECGGVPDEESVLALRSSVLETPLVDRAVVVDDPARTMGQPIFPLPVVVGAVLVDVVQWQFDSFPF